MRVLLVNKYFYPRGGAERSLFTLNGILEEAGHQTIHLAMRDPVEQLLRAPRLV